MFKMAAPWRWLTKILLVIIICLTACFLYTKNMDLLYNVVHLGQISGERKVMSRTESRQAGHRTPAVNMQHSPNIDKGSILEKGNSGVQNSRDNSRDTPDKPESRTQQENTGLPNSDQGTNESKVQHSNVPKHNRSLQEPSSSNTAVLKSNQTNNNTTVAAIITQDPTPGQITQNGSAKLEKNKHDDIKQFTNSKKIPPKPKKKKLPLQKGGVKASHGKTTTVTIETGPCVNYHTESRDRAPVDILGVELDVIRDKLIEPSKPLSFLKEFKNPCWIERLPQNFQHEYRQSPWSSYGAKGVELMTPVFQQRLNSTNPWRVRCLPYVYLAGVTKSGTTDMYGTLALHPDVKIPWVKEYMFWNKHRYPKGAISHEGHRNGHIALNKFVTQFDYTAYLINQTYVTTPCGHRHNGITIDGSSYLFWEDNGWDQDPANAGLKEPVYTNADALHDAQPDAKIIVLMREPSSRVYSAFSMYTHEPHLKFNVNHTTPAHFHEFVKSGINAYKDCFREHGIRACAYNASLSCRLHPISLRPSFYSVYLKDWWKAFGKDQVLVVKSEDYYSNRSQTFDRASEFLGLKPVSDALRLKIRARGPSLKRKYSKILPRTKQLLQKFYAPFNSELEKLLGKRMW